jgi:hypothetical protein
VDLARPASQPNAAPRIPRIEAELAAQRLTVLFAQVRASLTPEERDELLGIIDYLGRWVAVGIEANDWRDGVRVHVDSVLAAFDGRRLGAPQRLALRDLARAVR